MAEYDPTDTTDEPWGPQSPCLRIPQPAPDSSGELGPFGAFWLGVALGAVLAGFAVGLWVAR